MKIAPRFSHRPPARRALAACLAAALVASGAARAEHEHAVAASSPPLDRLRAHASSMRATASENGANRFAGWLANAVFAPSATTIVVTNCNGEHDGSLPSALAQAIDGDTVDMSRLTCGTITLQNGELATAAASVTLVGPGADRLAISGAGNHRVIDHAGTGTLHVQGLTLRDGAGVGNGGCIRSAGNVDLEKSVVTACHASDNTLGGGGGIFASGDLVMNESRLTDNVASNSDNTSYGGGALIRGAATITRSTISGNSAQYSGGGLMIYHAVDIEESTISGNRVSAPYSQGGGLTMLNFPGDDKRLAYDTFSGNSATQAGGAIEAYGPFSILASTIASNAAARGGGLDSGAAMAVFTTIVSGNASLPGSTDIGGSGTVIGNHDLVGTSMPALPGGTLRSDPLLGPLAGNGGPTLTHSLLSGSPAIDAIRETAADSPTTGFGNRGNAVDLIDRHYDQRGDGAARRVGAGIDIGAYEVQSTGVTRTVGSCEESGAGSLRDVLGSALSGDTIDLRHLPCPTISLSTPSRSSKAISRSKDRGQGC